MKLIDRIMSRSKAYPFYSVVLSDLDKAAKLLMAQHQEEQGYTGEPDNRAWAEVRSEMRDMLQRIDTFVKWAIDPDSGEVIGQIAFRVTAKIFEPGENIEVFAFYVIPEARKRHAGVNMLRMLLGSLQGHLNLHRPGYRMTVTFSARPTKDAFYQRLGARIAYVEYEGEIT